MEKKNYTSLEKSKKLLELGLNPESADMYYPWDADSKSVFNIPIVKDDYSMSCIPCWSLGALLEVMPKAINKYCESIKCYKTYHLNLYLAFYHCSGYAFGPSLNQENHDMLCSFGDDTWLDVIYKQVIWLLEHGYIKKRE